MRSSSGGVMAHGWVMGFIMGLFVDVVCCVKTCLPVIDSSLLLLYHI
jgi:hypothetical protein